MTYKQLAEDALDVATNARSAEVSADHLRRAQVYATLALVEAQDLSNRMHYAIDWATGDEHYAELGQEVRTKLGLAS